MDASTKPGSDVAPRSPLVLSLTTAVAAPRTLGQGALRVVVTGLSLVNGPRPTNATYEALARIAAGQDPSEATALLDSLIDSAVVTGADGTVHVLRSGASPVRLFARKLGEAIEITDELPVSTTEPRLGWLAFQMAHGVLSPFDRRASLQTVLPGYVAIPPGSLVRLRSGYPPRRWTLDHSRGPETECDRHEAEQAVHAGLDRAILRHLEAAPRDATIAFELSGEPLAKGCGRCGLRLGPLLPRRADASDSWRVGVMCVAKRYAVLCSAHAAGPAGVGSGGHWRVAWFRRRGG